MIFGSLALEALPKGLFCQACKVHPLPQLVSGAHWPEEFVNGGNGSSSSDHSSDIVGRGLSSVEPLHVTAVAEQVPVQRETAAAFFITQLHPAVLGERDT